LVLGGLYTLSDFDSIYLIPTQISEIRSRSDVNMESDFMGLYPIISSPMKGVSGWELVKAMSENNCLGILHRFDTFQNRLQNIRNCENGRPFGIAIGVNNWLEELAVAEQAIRYGAKLICLDLANGYLPQIKEVGKKLKQCFGNDIKLMTGNIINSIGAQYIKDSGFDFVRCSIGSGNVCTTRQMTGIGRNALNVLVDCGYININLVMDGGIKYPGDGVKAFACGADFLMLGSTLALAYETENKEGKLYGMASATNHELNNKEIKSIEGRDAQLDISQKKPLKEILDQFLWGIKSACTYLNCNSYKEIQFKTEIIEQNEKLF
jgi:GMP reductase